MGFQLERIEECTDSVILTEIQHKAFITVAKKFGYTIENAPYFSAFIKREKIDKQMIDGCKFYVYKIEENIIGSIGYILENDNYVIERLAVIPEYRHNGIGKKLMEFIENEVKCKNAKKIQLAMVDNNLILKEWYKKLGYKIIETKDKGLIFKITRVEKKL